MEPCLCGDTDCRRCFPGHVEVTEAHLDAAMEVVIETILRYGEYPRNSDKSTRKFDLYDYLLENDDPSYALEFYVQAMGYTSAWSLENRRDKEIKRITKILEEALKDSQIVTDLAEQYASETEEA